MRTKIAIIGSGFGGLGMAIKLLESGERDFVVLERAHDVGGVWRDNTYPGAACDVRSHLYSFSFAPNPHWTRSFSRQAEIQRYLRGCAERFGVMPFVRFNREVQRASWIEQERTWRIETNDGVFEADVLIGAGGALSEPSIPPLPGLDTFAGVKMHSARWDHTVSLEGKRVGVVGTGASAIQFIPQIQPKVQKLVVFQRTPAWVVPRGDRAISESMRGWFARVPLLQRAARALIALRNDVMLAFFRVPRLRPLMRDFGKAHLKRSVPDYELRKKLTPKYDMGCKRILLSDDYLPAMTQPNVDVVTHGVVEVRPHSVVDAAGAEHPVDVLIFGTGFHVANPPMAKHIFGRGGQSLADAWAGSPKAHVGTTITGFPGFFLLMGPNTGTGHTSVIGIIESQIAHVLGALAHMKRSPHVAAVEPTAEALAQFVRQVDDKMQNTVWTAGSCSSWYLDETGRNSTLWPTSTRAFHKRVAPFNPREYSEVPRV
jgi:cation diffusion facilitator CzcD-associated flavoprotein CzcO